MFVGRQRELQKLKALLQGAEKSTDAKPGKAVLIRGRRRVGKSRMVEEFLGQTRVPHVFFAATGRSTSEELQLFASEVAGSNLPGAAIFQDVRLESWDAALRLLSSALPEQGAVIVLDELPYIIANDPGFEGTLQRSFDRDLSRKHVLLIGIGSDISMMESLNRYGRPFHQRATEMVVPALNPREVGKMIGLHPTDSFDAYLVSGGLPLICSEWGYRMSLWDYLEEAVVDPTSALLVSAERSLAAEFPSEAQAKTVLQAIGSGERTFANIARASGNLQPTSLKRSLDLLIAKHVVEAEIPLSTATSRNKRYRVADPYLSFWLTFLGPYIGEIERGRGDRVLARIGASWTSWRGRVIEPVLRDALSRLSPPMITAPNGSPGTIGAYWTRTNSTEVDIVVTDDSPIASSVLAIGSIKWREAKPFDAKDLRRLQAQRQEVPGSQPDTPLLALSRCGSEVDGVICFSPEDLLEAYPES